MEEIDMSRSTKSAKKPAQKGNPAHEKPVVPAQSTDSKTLFAIGLDRVHQFLKLINLNKKLSRESVFLLTKDALYYQNKSQDMDEKLFFLTHVQIPASQISTYLLNSDDECLSIPFNLDNFIQITQSLTPEDGIAFKYEPEETKKKDIELYLMESKTRSDTDDPFNLPILNLEVKAVQPPENANRTPNLHINARSFSAICRSRFKMKMLTFVRIVMYPTHMVLEGYKDESTFVVPITLYSDAERSRRLLLGEEEKKKKEVQGRVSDKVDPRCVFRISKKAMETLQNIKTVADNTPIRFYHTPGSPLCVEFNMGYYGTVRYYIPNEEGQIQI